MIESSQFKPKNSAPRNYWKAPEAQPKYTWSDGVTAAARLAYTEELGYSAYKLLEYNGASGGQPIDESTLDLLNKEYGTGFEYREGMTRPQFDILRDLYYDRLLQYKKIEASGIGFTSALLGSFAGSMADPTNILTVFLPAMKVKPIITGTRASSTAKIAMAYAKRGAKVGAITNTIESVVREPFVLQAQAELQTDYGLLDSMFNLGLSPVVGGVLGGFAGGLKGIASASSVKRKALDAANKAMMHEDPDYSEAVLTGPLTREDYDRVQASYVSDGESRVAAEMAVGRAAVDLVDSLRPASTEQPTGRAAVDLVDSLSANKRRTEDRLEAEAFSQRTAEVLESIKEKRRLHAAEDTLAIENYRRGLTADHFEQNSHQATTANEHVVDFVARKLFGLNVRYFDEGFERTTSKEGAASYRYSDRIYVSSRTGSIGNLMRIAGHEVFHNIRFRSPDVYDKLYSAIANAQGGKVLKRALEETLVRQPDLLKQPFHVKVEEAMADIMGDMFRQPKFLTKVLQDNPDIQAPVLRLLFGIYRRLSDVVDQMTSRFGVATARKDLLKLHDTLYSILKTFDPESVADANLRTVSAQNAARENLSLKKIPKNHPARSRLWQYLEAADKEIDDLFAEANKDMVAQGFSFFGGTSRAMEAKFGKNTKYLKNAIIRSIVLKDPDLRQKYTIEAAKYIRLSSMEKHLYAMIGKYTTDHLTPLNRLIQATKDPKKKSTLVRQKDELKKFIKNTKDLRRETQKEKAKIEKILLEPFVIERGPRDNGFVVRWFRDHDSQYRESQVTDNEVVGIIGRTIEEEKLKKDSTYSENQFFAEMASAALEDAKVIARGLMVSDHADPDYRDSQVRFWEIASAVSDLLSPEDRKKFMSSEESFTLAPDRPERRETKDIFETLPENERTDYIESLISRHLEEEYSAGWGDKFYELDRQSLAVEDAKKELVDPAIKKALDYSKKPPRVMEITNKTVEALDELEGDLLLAKATLRNQINEIEQSIAMDTIFEPLPENIWSWSSEVQQGNPQTTELYRRLGFVEKELKNIEHLRATEIPVSALPSLQRAVENERGEVITAMNHLTEMKKSQEFYSKKIAELRPKLEKLIADGETYDSMFTSDQALANEFRDAIENLHRVNEQIGYFESEIHAARGWTKEDTSVSVGYLSDALSETLADEASDFRGRLSFSQSSMDTPELAGVPTKIYRFIAAGFRDKQKAVAEISKRLKLRVEEAARTNRNELSLYRNILVEDAGEADTAFAYQELDAAHRAMRAAGKAVPKFADPVDPEKTNPIVQRRIRGIIKGYRDTHAALRSLDIPISEKISRLTALVDRMDLEVMGELRDYGKRNRLSRAVDANGIVWLKSFLDGTYRKGLDPENMPQSHEARINARRIADREPMLEVLGRHGAFRKFDDINNPFAREVVAVIESGEKSGRADIDEVAQVLIDINDAQVAELRTHGVAISKKQGYWMSTVHSITEIDRIGAAEWKRRMMADYLDIEETANSYRTFASVDRVDFEEIHKMPSRELVSRILDDFYADLKTGYDRPEVATLDDLHESMTNPLTHGRTLQFRRGKQFDYDKDFGTGDPAKAITEQIMRRSEVLSNVEAFGRRPEEMIERFLAERGIKKGTMEHNHISGLVSHHTGKLDRPVNKKVAAWYQTIRNVAHVAFLGRAVFMALHDFAASVATIQYADGVRNYRAAGQLSLAMYQSFLRRMGDQGEQIKFVARGAGFDAVTNSMARRWTSEVPTGGSFKKLVSVMFDVNLVNLWTTVAEEALVDVLSQSAARTMAQGDEIGGLGTMLSRYRIDEKIISAHTQMGSDGVARFLPELIEDPAVAMRARAMFDELLKSGVLRPDASSQVLFRAGLRAGTHAGESVRTMTSYMPISAAIYTRIMKRMLNGYGQQGFAQFMSDPTNRAMMNFLTFLTISGSIGYVGMVLKDVTALKEPWLLYNTNEQYLRRWLFQTGLAGPMSDFIFARNGAQFGAAALGPFFGEAANFAGEAVNLNASSAVRSLSNLTPFGTLPPVMVMRRELLAAMFSDGIMETQRITANSLE